MTIEKGSFCTGVTEGTETVGQGCAFTEAERGRIAAAFRLLGALFYSAPDDANLAPFLNIIREGKLTGEWPFGSRENLVGIQEQMAGSLDDGLLEARQRLFIGPDDFQAPAWGSVYLDREKVIFGDSTLELRWFLAQHDITMDTGLNEPEDHIGLLFWLVSDFIANAKDDAMKELLRDHILPWSGRYLELLLAHAGHPFYTGLAQLAALTLDGLANRIAVTSRQRTLYL